MMTGIIIGVLVGQNLFAKTYGGASEDYLNAFIKTPDGGYAAVGATNSYGIDSTDILVIKVSATGQLQWAKTIGGSRNEEGTGITRTTDGGYAITGYTSSYGAGICDIFIVKLDSLGIVQWTKTWGSSHPTQPDRGYSIITTSEGYLIVGQYLGQEGVFLWFDTLGNYIRHVAAPSNSAVALYAVTQSSDGGYVATGYRYNGGNDLIILKSDASGHLVWCKAICDTFQGSGAEYGRSIVRTWDGGYAVAGYANGWGAGNYNFIVIKTDGSGNIQWAKTLGGPLDDQAYSICQTSDGGYAVAGWSYSFGAGSRDLLVARLSLPGDLIWARTFGAESYEGASGITQLIDGSYTLAGLSQSFGAGGKDCLLIRLDSNGNYNGCVQDAAVTLGNIFPDTVYAPPYDDGASQPIGNMSVTALATSLTVMDACPTAVKETGTNPPGGIWTIGFSGGVIFWAEKETLLKIYASDGRLVLSQFIFKGKNWIGLEKGVYFWRAGPYKGKVAVLIEKGR